MPSIKKNHPVHALKVVLHTPSCDGDMVSPGAGWEDASNACDITAAPTAPFHKECAASALVCMRSLLLPLVLLIGSVVVVGLDDPPRLPLRRERSRLNLVQSAVGYAAN